VLTEPDDLLEMRAGPPVAAPDHRERDLAFAACSFSQLGLHLRIAAASSAV
jgi:hypothetical protein